MPWRREVRGGIQNESQGRKIKVRMQKFTLIRNEGVVDVNLVWFKQTVKASFISGFQWTHPDSSPAHRGRQTSVSYSLVWSTQ